MSKTTLFSILIFAGLLAGVYLARQQPAEKGISRLSFADVDKAAIDTLTLEGPEPVEVQKQGETWMVAGKYKASKSAVTAAIDTIPQISSSELISTNDEHFATYEVDDETGTHVVAKTGGKIVADFVVGKAAPGGTYLRVGDEVFAAKGVYAYTFARKKAQWFELKLFEETVDAVDRAELGPKDAPYVLEKTEAGWELAAGTSLPEGFRFDANVARNRVGALLGLRARELLTEAPGPEVTGLGEDAVRVSFTAGETRRVLILGQAKADDTTGRYAQVEGSETVYLLHGSNVDSLLAPVTRLRDLTLLKLDPTTVSSLEIVRAKDRLLLKKENGIWAPAESTTETAEDFEFDPAQVEQRLASLKNTRGLGLIEDPAAEKMLAKPDATLTATLEDGSKVVLELGEEMDVDGQNWIPARGNVDDAIYGLSVFVRNNLTGNVESFKRVPTPQLPGGMQLDPAMMKNLPPEVREALMKKQMEDQQMKDLAGQLPPVSPRPPRAPAKAQPKTAEQ